MEATVREQGRALNDVARNTNAPAAPAIPSQPEPDITPEQFFADPGKVLAARDEKLLSKLTNHLNEIIQPFREDVAVTKVNNAWATVRERYSDLDQYRDYIETQIVKHGITEPNAGTIRLFYLDARDSIGIDSTASHSTGIPVSSPSPSSSRPAPPQHSASRQPIHPQDGGKSKLRALTESEKAVSRMQGFKSDEEYLNWLEVDERDVATSKLGVTQ